MQSVQELKKYKSIIKKKKKKKHDKMLLLGKAKLGTIEVLISKALIDSYNNCDEFVSINNVLRKYNEIKEGIKHSETSAEYSMVDISRKTYERNGIETIVNNDGILWLNEKHVEEELNNKKFREITTKYYSDHRKHRQELDNK